MVRTRPSRAIASAVSKSPGTPRARAKSSPVPRGSRASCVLPPARRSPLTASCAVPSPPTATTRLAPSADARAASSAISPGRVLNAVSPSSPAAAARRASSGHLRPVEPPAEAGLTRKTVSLMRVLLGRDGHERKPGHPVDGRAQLLVRDAREGAADDDVADGEQASGVHAPQRADREEDGCLHLDGEDAAAGPPLVPALVRVVERVARGDGPEPNRLPELLRRVEGAVDELPVGGGTVRLAADVVPRRAVRWDGRE